MTRGTREKENASWALEGPDAVRDRGKNLDTFENLCDRRKAMNVKTNVKAGKLANRSSRWVALVVLVLAILGAANRSVAAEIFVNDYYSGRGNCSLVEAIYSANFHTN